METGSDDEAREMVLSSWQRCVTQHRLSRDASRPILRLQSAEIGHRRKQFVEELGGDTSELDNLFRIAQRAQHYAVVADAECVLVMRDAGSNRGEDFASAGIVDGSCWNEQIAATNGVSMALRHRRPVTVAGRDHFYSVLANFRCTAAPLFDHEDIVIGAVNLSSFDRGGWQDRVLAQHLISLATARIQARLFHARYADCVRALIALPSPGVDSSENALLAIDQLGKVVGATNAAANALGEPLGTALVGMDIADVMDATVDELLESAGSILRVDAKCGAPLSVAPAIPTSGGRSTVLSRTSPRKAGPITVAEYSEGDDGTRRILCRGVDLLRAGLAIHVCGEAGTGKRTVAQAIRVDAGLAKWPTVEIDCAAVTGLDDADLVFAEALQRAKANALASSRRFPAGTLVVHCIEALDSKQQLRLASFLGEIEESQRGEAGDFGRTRVVTSSRRHPAELGEREEVAPELLGHILASVVDLVPLRRRPGIDQTLRRVAHRVSRGALTLSDAALGALSIREWNGNFRELAQVLRQASVVGNGRVVHLADLPTAWTSSGLGTERPSSLSTVVDNAVRQVTEDALLRSGWKVAAAARLCGVSRATMHRRVSSFGLVRPRDLIGAALQSENAP